jgi:hypothetical protein
VIGPAATTSEVEQLISDDIPAAALVEINLREASGPTVLSTGCMIKAFALS